MRKKRAVLLRKVATMILGANMARTLQQLEPQRLESSTRKIYRKLKAEWKATPKDRRASLSAFHGTIVARAA